MTSCHALRACARAGRSRAARLPAPTSADDGDESGRTRSGEVVLVTHESFHLPEDAGEAVRGGVRLPLDVRAAGDAGALTNKLVAHQGQPDRRRRVRRRQHLRLPRARRGGLRAVRRRACRRAPRSTSSPGDDDASGSTPVDNGERVRQRRRHLVRRRSDLAPPASLDDLADPAYRDLFVTPGARRELAGLAFLLATIAAYGEDGWPDYWTDLLGQRREAHRRAGRTPTTSTSPRAAARATARSCCPTTPRRRSPSPKGGDHDQRAARHLLPPGGVRRRARRRRQPRRRRGAGRLPAQPEVQAALPESMYVFPVDAGAALPAGLGGVRRAADRPARGRPGRDRRRTATTG